MTTLPPEQVCVLGDQTFERVEPDREHYDIRVVIAFSTEVALASSPISFDSAVASDSSPAARRTRSPPSMPRDRLAYVANTDDCGGHVLPP
jgi:hypothetical protein